MRSTEIPRGIALRVTLVRALLIAWPVVHFFFVRTYASDPWKLGGWAMYSTPSPSVELGVHDGKGLHAIPDGCESEAARFVAWRRGIGTLATPDALIRCVQRHASLDHGVLIVRRSFLDGHSQTIKRTVSRYAIAQRPL